MASNAPQQQALSSTGSGTLQPKTQEFRVRVPKGVKKKYTIFQFNAANNVDFTKSGPTKVERENNLRDFKLSHDIDQMPKYGAGSEFGREQKEEARRKKYGIMKRKYNPEAQPWLMKMGAGKQTRKFKGIKNGGVMENSSFYIFTQCADGAFDAFPVEDWYNFTPVVKYRHLNFDEAEEEFNRRDRTLNYFNLMLKKRLKNEEDGEEESEGNKSKQPRSKGLKLTEMDDWADFSDENSGDDDSDGGERRISRKKQKAINEEQLKKKKKKSRKANSDDEAVEESDSMDEGQEIDYMSDSGESNDEGMYDEKDLDEDKYGEKGVADEDGLRKLVDSEDEEDEEEEEKKKRKLEEGEEDSEDEEGSRKKRKEGDESDSESSSSSGSDSDPDKEEIKSALFMQKKAAKRKLLVGRESGSSDGSAANSRSGTPTADLAEKAKKRPNSPSPAAKKMKLDSLAAFASTPSATSSGGDTGITEEAVRRYLMRKPMTTTDLVRKFRTKNTGLTNDQQVKTIAQIVKRLNPEQRQIKDKLYLFIRKQ